MSLGLKGNKRRNRVAKKRVSSNSGEGKVTFLCYFLPIQKVLSFFVRDANTSWHAVSKGEIQIQLLQYVIVCVCEYV